MPQYKHAIVTCARWDTERICEWLNYYRSIGFDHVYLYSNDDDPTNFYQVLLPYVTGPDPFVTFYHYRALGMQRWTLVHCTEHHGDEFEWIAQFDIDEYLSLRNAPDIGSFIAALPPADSIYFNWVFFGHNGHAERVPDLLLNYTRRQEGLDRHTKTITRRAAIRTDLLRADTFRDIPAVSVYHGWKDRPGEGMRCINAIGDDMTTYYDDFEVDTLYTSEHAEQLFAAAVLHHYAFQSEGDFKRRMARGTAGEHQGQVHWGGLSATQAQKFLGVIGAVEDTTLREYWLNYLAPAWTQAVLPLPEGRNLALGRPCLQSTIAAGLEDTAHMTVNGAIGFRAAFQTDAQEELETPPFWDVDLGEVHDIRLVLIFNRLDDFPERSANLDIWLSTDGDHFDHVFRKDDGIAFGGVDGHPLAWRPEEAMPCRVLRISLVGRARLHLAQVEVY